MKTTVRILFFLVALISVCSAGVRSQSPDVFDRKKIEEKMLLAAKWQFAHPNHELYDWTNGAFYAGVFAAYKTTRSPELFKALIDMGEANKWSTGRRFDHADDIVISQTYIDLYRITRDKKMLTPTVDTVERLIN